MNTNLRDLHRKSEWIPSYAKSTRKPVTCKEQYSNNLKNMQNTI